MGDSILLLFLIIAVLLFVFLLLRQLNLWYWKINTLVSLLEEIRALLRYNLPEEVVKKISETFSKESSSTPILTKENDATKTKSTVQLSDKDWLCRCGTVNSKLDAICKKCGRAPNAVV